MGFEENVVEMQRGNVDRISELPEFILHTILSMLDTKEACRATVLSKRWYGAWSSVPVLDFHLRYFHKYGNYPINWDDDTLDRFVGFIDKTMQRYSMHKYRITKMYLRLPQIDEKLDSLIDDWIMIAVQNQIEDFVISVFHTAYRLPEILFCTKSLKDLTCEYVALPYYKTMELALENLTLFFVSVHEDMLQRIISSSPLVELDITCTYDCLVNISLPWMKRGNGGEKCRSSGTMKYSLQEYPLQKFSYSGLFEDELWPWNMNIDALKNLRKLEFDYASITDDVVSELAFGLVALESLVLSFCFNLKDIKISSNSLKEFRILAYDFIKVTIDAPKLLEFTYNTIVETSVSFVRVPDHCNAQFLPLKPDSVTTVWLVELKKFLVETNFFKSLVIEFLKPLQELLGVVDEDELRNTDTGVPYKLSELKICEISDWNLTEYSFVGFLDALFWCCHPDVLSITTSLENSAFKLILDILDFLKAKVHCYKDPLRSMLIEGADCSSLLSKRSKIEIRFRLTWF